MAYLKPYDFIQLKAFFLALQQSRFNLSQTSSRVILDGIPTPIDKLHCLTLLRSFPDLQGEKFKDDNSLIKYLSQPGNIQRILGQLPIDQQVELTKALVEKPATVEVAGGQPAAQATPAGQGPQMPNFPSASIKPSIPTPIINSAKNFSSTAQIFTRTNLGRIGRGLGDMVKGAGRGIGSPILNGAYRGLGKAGSGLLNAGTRFSNATSFSRLGGLKSTKLKGFGTGKKVTLAFSLFGLLFGVSVFSALSQSPTNLEAAPISSTGINGLNYTLPLKNPAVSPQDIGDQIKTAFPSAKIEYWDTVINTSKTAGINPALALALWVEETGASQTTVVRNGGGGIPNKDGKYTLGHLGCAPLQDQTIDESLTCLIKFINSNNFTNNDFPQFMAKYSSGPPSDPFSNNPNFPKNFNEWYSKLVPTGLGAIQTLTASFTSVLAPEASTNYQTLHDDILKKFNIDFDRNFSYDYLKWGWAKLWNASGTKFFSLINPNNERIDIIRDDSGINEQIGCNKVRMRGRSASTGQPYPEALFKYVFLHELSHIIENCYPGVANKNKLDQIIKSPEGYLTAFSQNSATCPGSLGDIPLNEDFADTISYYLNSDIAEQSLGIGPACEPQNATNPYANGNKPLHQQFAQALLGAAASQPSAQTGLPQFSCPMVGGGRNVLPSYQFQPDGATYGHCGTLYVGKEGFACANGTDSRRAKSVDIESCINPRPNCSIATCKPLTPDEWDKVYQCGESGKDLKLPTLNGEVVQWQYLGSISLNGETGDCFDYEMRGGTPDPATTGNGCGVGYMFKSSYQGHSWTLHLLHLHGTTLEVNALYPSGTPLGKTQAVHTHISVGEDIANPLSQNESGWMSADLKLNICDSQTNLGYK